MKNSPARKNARRTTQSPESLAQRVVADYYMRQRATIHHIVETNAESFRILLDSISGRPEIKRLREVSAVEEKLRGALPGRVDDFEKLDDLHAAELLNYMEACYLIGLAVGRQTTGGAR